MSDTVALLGCPSTKESVVHYTPPPDYSNQQQASAEQIQAAQEMQQKAAEAERARQQRQQQAEQAQRDLEANQRAQQDQTSQRY
jgi:uncharacterized protein YbcC (UPF0753/DUF2309 family)